MRSIAGCARKARAAPKRLAWNSAIEKDPRGLLGGISPAGVDLGVARGGDTRRDPFVYLARQWLALTLILSRS
jgi:hypothetical protein